MLKIIKMQWLLMVNKLSFKVAFSIVLLYNLISYLKYLLEYKGIDVINFYSTSFLFSGNTHSSFWSIFETSFPFLVVFPFAFSYTDDLNSGIYMYIISRLNKTHYFISKLLMCFIRGGILILIPFFINQILCSITFAENNTTPLGPFNLISYYEVLTGANVIIKTNFIRMPLLKVYLTNPFIYNTIFIFILSFFSGVLSMFSGACSFLLSKHKLILFIPVYMLFFISNIIDSIIYINMRKISYTNFRWMNYTSVNTSIGRNYVVFSMLLIGLITFCIIVVVLSKRRDII